MPTLAEDLGKLAATALLVKNERDLAITALRQIRNLTTSQSHSTSRLMRGIAADALEKLESR